MSMKKDENRNYPVKGSSITVKPIRILKDIEKIKRILAPQINVAYCA